MELLRVSLVVRVRRVSIFFFFPNFSSKLARQVDYNEMCMYGYLIS